jgi:hypothetical protein
VFLAGASARKDESKALSSCLNIDLLRFSLKGMPSSLASSSFYSSDAPQLANTPSNIFKIFSVLHEGHSIS